MSAAGMSVMREVVPSAGSATGARVLVVDDQPANRRALEGLLAPLDYSVHHAADGAEALAEVSRLRPDLVLLDVLMPGLTGIEVCERLKSAAETRFLPVLLVTSLSDRPSRIAGLEAGADDFLARPVDPVELRARVKSLLRAKQLHDELTERCEELQRVTRSRERLVQMMVHDLRNPLVSIVGHLELLEGGVTEGESARNGIRLARRNADRLVGMITDILDVARLESGRMPLAPGAVDVCDALQDVVSEISGVARTRDVRFEVVTGEKVPRAWADASALRRVFVNIASNAISFAPKGTRIVIAVRAEGGDVTVSMTDSGRGIPADRRSRIFEAFTGSEEATSGRRFSTGLGLAFCKLAVEAQGGTIGVESAEGQGSTFWVRIPAEPSA